LPTQKQTIDRLRETLKKLGLKHRLIKIHGGRYQEAGLPDLMIFIRSGKKTLQMWVEIKRSWRDTPEALQRWNVEENLPQFGWVTGYLVGTEFKHGWDHVDTLNIKSVIFTELRRRR